MADAASISRAMADRVKSGQRKNKFEGMACKPVVISGHGPAGTMLALYLVKHGIPVVLLEKAYTLPRDPRASTFHPPTLEMMEAVGIAEACVAKGLRVNNYQYRDRRTGEVADFQMSMLSDETQFPFRLQLEQWEMVLIGHNKLKEDYPDLVDIRLGTRLNWIEQHADGVTVHVEDAVTVDAIEACFIVGADGSSSTLRKLLKINFSGFTYDERFLVLSTEFRFEQVFENLSYVNYVSDPDEWCVILKTDKNWRVLFPTNPAQSAEEILSDEWAQARLQHLHKTDGPYKIEHKSMYAVHQRVAEKYYVGRAVLVGDACHVHNPLGGMGMNGGVHDAWCVAQKLVKILKQGADYSAEFADYDQHRRLLSQSFIQKHTIENKALMESTDPEVQRKRQADFMRKAGDPALAKEFLKERAMLKLLREGFKVSNQSELVKMPLLDAPILPGNGSPAKSLAEESERIAAAPFKGQLGFGEKCAILVVDFTLAYVTPGSKLYCGDPECGVISAVRHTADLLPLGRRKGVPVVFTRVLYDPNCGARNGGVFVQKVPLLTDWKEGEKMCDIVPELPVCPGDHVLVKQYPSAFFGTPLAAMLTAQRVDTIILTGCSTSGCIRATATDAMQHGFRVVVPRQCVGDRVATVHEANLFDINAKVGDVLPKEAVLAHLESLPAAESSEPAEKRRRCDGGAAA
eukprot:CAMPEP_0204597802 /NCGR_PEP_ID=MMETSP0661-20131031/53991_1 /ASSEMBLY_ACC=CAM_ASM_000606 /TAXON_ID=109239 /ORGANISM="Alexandrium margalefi, Strain AMGDE01CS-322" /LENGTH=687 /DNA_ID=CAMNT_0051608501 /DNA_START=21 /DNA_END=2084 /DNA_ORIENTATION=-